MRVSELIRELQKFKPEQVVYVPKVTQGSVYAIREGKSKVTKGKVVVL